MRFFFKFWSTLSLDIVRISFYEMTFLHLSQRFLIFIYHIWPNRTPLSNRTPGGSIWKSLQNQEFMHDESRSDAPLSLKWFTSIILFYFIEYNRKNMRWISKVIGFDIKKSVNGKVSNGDFTQSQTFNYFFECEAINYWVVSKKDNSSISPALQPQVSVISDYLIAPCLIDACLILCATV